MLSLNDCVCSWQSHYRLHLLCAHSGDGSCHLGACHHGSATHCCWQCDGSLMSGRLCLAILWHLGRHSAFLASYCAVASDVAIDGDTATSREGRTVVGVAGVENWEHIFPVVFFLGTLKCSDDKHEHLGTHTNGEQQVTHGKVQDLEQCTPDNDSGTYTVGKVEKALSNHLPFSLALSSCFIFLRNHCIDMLS